MVLSCECHEVSRRGGGPQKGPTYPRGASLTARLLMPASQVPWLTWSSLLWGGLTGGPDMHHVTTLTRQSPCSCGNLPSVTPSLRGEAGPQPRPGSLHQTTPNCRSVGHKRLNNGNSTWFNLQHVSRRGGPSTGYDHQHTQKIHSIPKSSSREPGGSLP